MKTTVKILMCLCCMFGLQLARGQDATNKAADSGTASQTLTNSTSYDDTMKWIQSKLEIWSDVELHLNPNNDISTSFRYKMQFDVSGNVEIIDQHLTNEVLMAEGSYNFNLSNITSADVAESQNPPQFFVILHSPQLIESTGIQEYIGPFHDIWLRIIDEQSAKRISNAFKHAIELVKAKEPKEPF